ncbi:MAG TPA: HAMP domain-containing sensor histidine kinase [Sporichthyaceae bacterium]|nr:HAMP domain-containing sensor histidine kinase [Sporichthyaceae bacterium]
MRRKILGVAVLAAALAVTLFGLPLAYAVHQLYLYDQEGDLERAALRASVRAEVDDPKATTTSLGGTKIGLYGLDGTRTSGSGPLSGGPDVTTAINTGVPYEHTGASEIVIAIPLFEDGKSVAEVVRAAAPRHSVSTKVVGAWSLLAGLALLAGVSSSLLAAGQARRLARPLTELERVAEELGDGNFAVRAAACGVEEIDKAGAALNRTAARLDDILARERAFTAVASHQLRTPLTDLRLGLEHALSGPDDELRAAARDAMSGADRLAATIDDVLTLARGTTTVAPLPVGPLLSDLRLRWASQLEADGRSLVIVERDHSVALASAAAVRQILDVLLDNARLHGQGTVTVTARSAASAVAIDVADEGHAGGPLVPENAPPLDGPRRLGLSIAASLAAAQNGRLVHARTDPTTRLTVLLPAAEQATDPG